MTSAQPLPAETLTTERIRRLAREERYEHGLNVLTGEPQLEVHINAALNVGLSPAEIVEALLHSAVYCGMPRALNATFVAKKVFAERDLLPVTTT